MNDKKHVWNKPEFPRSGRYDPDWMMDNQMGPNAVWLAEWLAGEISLKPGMRVLDLGCGRAITSIFMANEYDVRVWAADLWIAPEHNWKRVLEADAADRVYPLRMEAHALPFPEGFFDAIVSCDAYQYFGTDELYLSYLSRYIRPGGVLGVVVPGFMQPFKEVPAHLSVPQSNGKVFWEDDCWSFKTADWWRDLWSRNRSMTDVRVDTMPDGWRHWTDFERALEASGKSIFPSDAEALEKDQGRYIGFVRVIAQRSDTTLENVYDPSIGIRAGLETQY